MALEGLAHPLALTDAQVRALEDFASLNQQEMFAPNQLSFADRLAALEARVGALDETQTRQQGRERGMGY